MDAVDRMLAELKAKYQPAENPASASPTPPSPVVAPLATGSLDDLLKTIHLDTRRAVRASLSTATTTHQPPRSQANVAPEKPHLSPPSKPQPVITRADAQNWLKQLKPTTEEGLWFEEFAFHYPSRLEAAIEYLAALQKAV